MIVIIRTLVRNDEKVHFRDIYNNFVYDYQYIYALIASSNDVEEISRFHFSRGV